MIGWLREFWPWLAGAGIPAVAIAAFAILNPAAALKLASSIAGWLLDLARGLVSWLRKPRTAEQKLRFVCLTLGFSCMLASFAAWDARRTIVVIREKCAADLQAEHGKVAEATTIAETNRAAVQTCRTTLQAEVGKRQAVERMAADAIAKAERSEAKAERDAADWQRRYERRPKGCTAALQEVQNQCATISDY